MYVNFHFFDLWKDKKAEGIVYLQRVAQMEEPEDAKSKVHYYDALLLLARYNLNYHWAIRLSLGFFSHVPPSLILFLSEKLNLITPCLLSALFDGGRKAEAGKLLRMLVAYDPSYKVYLEEFEKDQDNFASDLASSRRGDYWLMHAFFLIYFIIG